MDAFTTAEIASWYRSKQTALAGSGISLTEIRQTESQKSTAVADFEASNALGQVTGNVTGEFDFHVLRVSDGHDVLWQHVDAEEISQLEGPFGEFVRALHNPGPSGE